MHLSIIGKEKILIETTESNNKNVEALFLARLRSVVMVNNYIVVLKIPTVSATNICHVKALCTISVSLRSKLTFYTYQATSSITYSRLEADKVTISIELERFIRKENIFFVHTDI